MVNKQNLWFVTLFSLILVLGIYYVSIDDDVIKSLQTTGTTTNSKEVINIEPSEELVSLEVEDDEEKQALMEEYQKTLLDTSSTNEEKNIAYEKMQDLNTSIGMEEKLKKKIKDNFKLNSFVKIKEKNISIIISSKNHTKENANNIIRSVQEEFNESMYITVKYQ